MTRKLCLTLAAMCAALSLLSLTPRQVLYAQEVGFVFVSDNDQRIQAFAGRGLAVDIMTQITSIRLEKSGRTVETFREVAPDVLVRTYDSLQTGTLMRAQIDRLLAISGDRLSTVDFVLIDDEGGLTSDLTEGITTLDDGGTRLIWPSTNVRGWLDQPETTVESLDEPDETLTIESLDEMDPEKRAEELNWEANFLDETADLLEELVEDSQSKLRALKKSISSAVVNEVSKEAILLSLRVQLDALSVVHQSTAATHDERTRINEGLEVVRHTVATRGVPVILPDVPTLEEDLKHQMDELVRLIQEVEAAEVDLAPAVQRLNSLRARRAQLVNEIERWQREAKADRERAAILRRRANGLLSGELNLADYRREVTTVSEGWTYEADVILGSTLAERFAQSFGEWSAWEGIILHRVLNSQLLSASLVAGRMSEPEEMPVFKAGWAEVAFLGGKFEEADLSTLPHQALETGVGIFLAGTRSEAFRNESEAFHARTGPKYVFPKDGSSTTGIPEELAGRYVGGFTDFGSLEGPVEIQMPYGTGTIEVGKLPFQDVPADYLLRSSATVAGFLDMVAAGWTDGSIVMEPLFEFLSARWDDVTGRNLPALARRFAIALEKSASEWTIGDANVPGAAGLMPLAYLDMLTNFGLTQSDVYPPSSPDEVKPAMFEEYWSTIRAGLRIGLDRNGPLLGESNLRAITKTADEYLVCAVKFVGDQGSNTPEDLVDTCWPETGI